MALNFTFDTGEKSATSSGGYTIKLRMTEAYTVSNDGTYNAYVKVIPTFTTSALNGEETLTFEVFNANNTSNSIGSKTVILKNNVASGSVYVSGAIPYVAPNFSIYNIFIKVTLRWNANTAAVIQTSYGNVGLPYITTSSRTNIGVDSVNISLKANTVCDRWEYRLGTSGSWVLFSQTVNNTVAETITGLSPNTLYTIYIRVKRQDMQNWSDGSDHLTAFTTLGSAVITDVTQNVEIDANNPSIRLVFDAYSASYEYTLTLGCVETPDDPAIFIDLPITGVSVGSNAKTINLTSYKSEIFAKMPNATSVTLRYILNTIIGNNTYQSEKTGKASVTAQRSSPSWNGTPHIYYSDVFTQNFFEDIVIDPTIGGYINGETELEAQAGASPGQGATAKNGASISYYYLTVGGIVVDTANNQYGFVSMWNNALTLEGETVEVIYGVIDSRGFKTEASFTVPIRQYTPIYWSKTLVRRDNYYGTTISFNIEAKYTKIDLTIDGNRYINYPSYLTIQYSINGGETWSNPIYVNGTISDTSVSYIGNPMPTIPNDKEVVVRIIADDAWETAQLILAVPKGIPLVHLENGKVVINGDLVVNGTITQNTPSADLTGTTWLINDSYTDLDCPWTTVTYNINFISNGNSYSSLKFDNYTIYYGNTAVFYPPPPQWGSQNYRTISITGGTDTTNADLIAWLQTYAVQQ